MRIKDLWPLGVVLIGLFSASCEDDPNDLDYLKAGAGGAAGSATAGSGGAAGSTAAAGAGGSEAGAAGH